MKKNISILLIVSLLLSTLFASSLYADQGFGWKEIDDYYILRENGELWFTDWWECDRDGKPDSQNMFRIMNNIKSIEEHDDILYVVKEDGELWTIEYKRIPKTTFNIKKITDGVVQVSVNDDDTFMVVKNNNELWGWGYNKYGQLLDGTTKYSYEPKKIMDNVKHVTAGYNRVFAVKTNGELWAWGFNPLGYLGDGTSDDAFEPKKLLDGVRKVDIYGDVTFAFKENGELWGWGSNYKSALYSELVDGNNIAVRNVTKPMKLIDNVKKAGPHYAIKENGDYYMWEESLHPKLGLTGVKDVSRTNKRMVIKENGEVYIFMYVDREFKEYDNISFMLGSGAIDKDGNFLDLRYDKANILLDSQQYINASKWALEGIKAADRNDLIEEAKKYPFNANINRETFAKLSLRLYEKLTNNREVELKNNPFIDTDDPEIIKAYSIGIIAGVKANEFSPKGSITREQIASMLKRTLEAANKQVPRGKEIKFSDIKDTSDWALDSVNYMNSIGIITGSDNKFNPKNYTTIEQACLMISRLYGKVNSK